ncbi:MAG TPA: TetR/AcrR family transcriptional regulator [Solirubrobacterales bacterium]|nr:TetR/AcrR family transcriptional regulator [Solirubrobacterales bacterium]
MAKGKQAGEDSPPGLARLPPGRHGLSREFVARNQRDRLTAGMIAAVAEHGFHEATITQIAAAAGVSRRTFYGYFSSKEECFFDAFGQVAELLEEAMTRAGKGEADWPARAGAELAALLEVFAANPDLARFLLIAPPSAGGEIAARYRELLDRLFAILIDGKPPPPETEEPSRAVTDGLLGGIVALVVRKVKADEGEELAELAPDLLGLFLAPYYGREQAVRLARPSS